MQKLRLFGSKASYIHRSVVTGSLALVINHKVQSNNQLAFGPTRDQLAAGNNFGVGSFDRNYPWYLWTRVKVSKVEGDEPYRLTRTADVDYWKSHICAVAIGSSKFMPKEMTRWYVDLPSSFTGVQKIKLVRALAREMTKLQATMAFECLSNDDIAKIVDEVGQTVIERGFE